MMKGGDLSNEVAPGVGFRFEGIIRTSDGKLNRAAKGYIHNILSSVNANVFFITTGDERKAAAFCYKWGITYTRIIKADSLLEIPEICNENQLLTYYDMDVDILQNVRARGMERVEAKQWTVVEVS